MGVEKYTQVLILAIILKAMTHKDSIFISEKFVVIRNINKDNDEDQLLKATIGDIFTKFNPENTDKCSKLVYGYLKHNHHYGYLPEDSIIQINNNDEKIGVDKVFSLKENIEDLVAINLRYGVHYLDECIMKSKLESYYSTRLLIFDIAESYRRFQCLNVSLHELKFYASEIVQIINKLRRILGKDIKIYSLDDHFYPNYNYLLDIFYRYRIATKKHYILPYINIKDCNMVIDDTRIEKKPIVPETINMFISFSVQDDSYFKWEYYHFKLLIIDSTTKEFPYITDTWFLDPKAAHFIQKSLKDSNKSTQSSSAVFNNLKQSDFYKNLILVVKVYFNNEKQSEKQKYPKGVFLIQIGSLTIDSNDLTMDSVKNYEITFHQYSEKKDSDITIATKKIYGKNPPLLGHVTILATKKEKSDVEYLFNSIITNDFCKIRSRYIPDIGIIEMEKDRYDVYLSLIELFMGKKTKSSKAACRVKIDLIFNNGTNPETAMIYYGDNVPPCFSVTSCVVLNTNNPIFNEEFRISLDENNYKGLFLRLIIFIFDSPQSLSGEAINCWDEYAFSLLPLSNVDGCMAYDGEYKLSLYNIEYKEVINSEDYVKWDYKYDDEIFKKEGNIKPIQNNYIVVKIQLVSSKLTSNRNIITIRNYASNLSENFNIILSDLSQLTNYDKLKFMNDIIFNVISITECITVDFELALDLVVQILSFITANKYANYVKIFKKNCQNISAPNFSKNLLNTFDKILKNPEKKEKNLNLLKLSIKCMGLLIYLINCTDGKTNDQCSTYMKTIKLFQQIQQSSLIHDNSMLASKTLLLKKYTSIFRNNPNVFTLDNIFHITHYLFNIVLYDDLKEKSSSDIDNREETPIFPFIQPFFTDYFVFMCSNYENSLPLIFDHIFKNLYSFFNKKCFHLLHITFLYTYLKLCEDGHITKIDDDLNMCIRKNILINLLEHANIYLEHIESVNFTENNYQIDVFVTLLKLISINEFVNIFEKSFQSTDLSKIPLETYLDLCHKVLGSDFFYESNFKLYSISIVSLLKHVPSLFILKNISSSDIVHISYSVDNLLIFYLNSDYLRFELLTPTSRKKFYECVCDIRLDLINCLIINWKKHINMRDNFIVTLLGYNLNEPIKQLDAKRFLNENNHIANVLSQFVLELYEYCGEHNSPSHEYMKNYIIDTITVDNWLPSKPTIQYLDNLKNLIEKKTTNTTSANLPTSPALIDLSHFLGQLRNIINSCDTKKKSLIRSCQELYQLKKTNEISSDSILYNYTVNKLAKYQLQQGNRTSAAYCYLDIASTMKWDDCILSSNNLFPIPEEEKSRKFKLMDKALDMFVNEKCFEEAMNVYKEIHPIIENIFFDYKLASEYYEKHSKCILNAINTVRAYPEYFLVRFHGLRFGESLNDKNFIYCGKNYAKLGEIINIMQNEYPFANIGSALEIKTAETNQNYIYITGVTPIPLSNLAYNNDVCEAIHTYYQHNNVKQFLHTKPIIEKKDSVNNWAEKTIYTCELSFPSILVMSPVIDISSQKVSPIENAIEDIVSKNNSLKNIINKIKRNDLCYIEKLTSCLNGIIDSAVNGGVALYCKEFLSKKSAQETKFNENLIQQLKKTLIDHLRLAFTGIHVHQNYVSPNLIELHNKIVSMSANMKELIEFYVGEDLSRYLMEVHKLGSDTDLSLKGFLDYNDILFILNNTIAQSNSNTQTNENTTIDKDLNDQAIQKKKNTRSPFTFSAYKFCGK